VTGRSAGRRRWSAGAIAVLVLVVTCASACSDDGSVGGPAPTDERGASTTAGEDRGSVELSVADVPPGFPADSPSARVLSGSDLDELLGSWPLMRAPQSFGPEGTYLLVWVGPGDSARIDTSADSTVGVVRAVPDPDSCASAAVVSYVALVLEVDAGAREPEVQVTDELVPC